MMPLLMHFLKPVSDYACVEDDSIGLLFLSFEQAVFKLLFPRGKTATGGRSICRPYAVHFFFLLFSETLFSCSKQ